MSESISSWAGVAAFRRAERERCRAVRAAAGSQTRQLVQANVALAVDELLRGFRAAGRPAPCFAFYWPIRGEVALFDVMQDAVHNGATVALPVVAAKDGPLQFRRWTPTTRMEAGAWNIPVPTAADEVDPQLLVVPVVGFDAGRYRLGNGGGYYDRTLAVRSPRPGTIGVGMECLRLPTIHPQPHDLPMDLMVTEAPLDLAALRSWSTVCGQRR